MSITLDGQASKNGELLRRAYSVCEVFVTLDRNLEFQQNIKVLPFGVVVVQALNPYFPSTDKGKGEMATGS
jgi:hypothetical protein